MRDIHEFVSQPRAHILKERVLGAPDLVLDVLSPNPRIGALQERIDWFATAIRSEPFDYNHRIRSHVLPAFARTVNEILEG